MDQLQIHLEERAVKRQAVNKEELTAFIYLLNTAELNKINFETIFFQKHIYKNVKEAIQNYAISNPFHKVVDDLAEFLYNSKGAHISHFAIHIS